MPFSVSFPDFVAGTPILSSQVDQNFTDLVNSGNTHEAATTGVHGVGAGAVMSTTAVQTVTGKKTFSGADTLLLPTTAPTVSQSVAMINGLLTLHDGSTAKTYNHVDLDSTGYWNLDITFAGSTLSITGAGGTALSASNPAYITLPSTTAGQTKTFKLTANQTINDSTSGSPQILGRWGTTASVAWGSNMPIYIMAINKDNTDANVRFALARMSHFRVTPSSTTNIGIAGTAPSSSDQRNFVLFGTAANTGYNSVPCMAIGSIRGTIDASAGGSMAVTALVAGTDGLGAFQENNVFDMPLGQNGAATGTRMKANGGTAPTFTLVDVGEYRMVPKTSLVYYNVIMTNSAGGTAGAGAVDAQLAAPFLCRSSSGSNEAQGIGSMIGTTKDTIVMLRQSSGTSSISQKHQTTIATATANLQNADYAAASRSIIGSIVIPLDDN